MMPVLEIATAIQIIPGIIKGAVALTKLAASLPHSMSCKVLMVLVKKGIVAVKSAGIKKSVIGLYQAMVTNWKTIAEGLTLVGVAATKYEAVKAIWKMVFAIKKRDFPEIFRCLAKVPGIMARVDTPEEVREKALTIVNGLASKASYSDMVKAAIEILKVAKEYAEPFAEHKIVVSWKEKIARAAKRMWQKICSFFGSAFGYSGYATA